MPTSGTGPFWSVIVPAERTNLIINPSFEFGTNGWETSNSNVLLGTRSGTGVFGAWGGYIAGKSPNVITGTNGLLLTSGISLQNVTYSLSAYVKGDGSIRILTGGVKDPATPGWGANLFGEAAGSFSDWGRLSFQFTPLTSTGYVYIMPAQGGTFTGTVHFDGIQLELGATTTYIDGDQEGCTWEGLPHNSTSKRGRDTRQGGSVVRLDDIGFTVDTSPGIGAPPFTTISQSYAQLDGGEFQRQRKAERRFTLTSLVDGTSWGDLHYQRRRLIEALRIENTPTQQPLRLLYSGAGGTLAIDAVWDGGVQFNADGQSFAEGVVASFTAYDPDWKDQLQQGTTLADNQTIGTMSPIIFRDTMGRWQSLHGSSSYRTSSVYAINESLSGGTIYAGLSNFDPSTGLTTRGLAWLARDLTRGTVGNGTIEGFIYDLKWDIDQSRLLIGGSLGTVAGTQSGQLAFWNPTTNTYGTVGFVGTGTRIDAGYPPTGATIRSILPWSFGTYYLGGGPFHRVNGTLLGSNWNILQWNGQLNGWSAASPVSVNGTGFIENAFWSTGGSFPGVVQSLERFDQNRMIVGASANTLRGFGTGINVALYDVRGTWGTVPGFRIPMSLSQRESKDAYRAPDRSVYVVYNGTSTVGTTVAKIQGLTAQNVGTISNVYANALAEDPDTAVWVGGEALLINNITQGGAIVRTTGYDYQPADIIIDKNCLTIFKSQSGTTYFGFDYFGAGQVVGTAASLGTIVNHGMSNVYPTLRLRNTSTTGTAIVRQWANMTTKEYAWFALSLLPGETATLTTGPGRIAFQSSYRGDILSTVVGGSKLASWKLLPGENIVSFLADTTDVVADMFWNPRHHSADGTGIV